MTILLDSTVLIDALRKEPGAVAALSRILRRGHMLATSVINVGELYSGVRPHEIGSLEELLQHIDAQPVTFNIARRAGELRNNAARKGRTLELDDMLVAATALELSLPVLTDNIKDFKSTGVELFDAGDN